MWSDGSKKVSFRKGAPEYAACELLLNKEVLQAVACKWKRDSNEFLSIQALC
jgi:hypothetical protein